MRRSETNSNRAPANATAPRTARPRVAVWLLAGLLGLVTVAVYWPALRYDFINFDDPAYVTANPYVQNGLNWASLKWAFRNTDQAAYWAPVTWLSHMLDCQLYGVKPWGHHFTNVLLHAFNAALVFILLRQLTGAVWRSLLVAALFAVHPLHVESVAWVAERKDVLSTFFGLLSLILYTRYAQTKQPLNSQPLGATKRSAGGSTLNYFLALLFFALGLMSKPMLVTWPFVMLLLDYWPLGRLRTTDYGLQTSRSLASLVTRHTSLIFEKLPFFALAAGASYVAFVVQKMGGAVMSLEHLSLGVRVENALISYCRYLGKLFWPTDLAVFYPHPGHWPLTYVLLATLLLIVMSIFFFVKRLQSPFLLMGLLWFGGTLVPVIQLVQAGGQAMADRFAYIPSLGVFIIAVWGASKITRRGRHRAIGLSLAGSAVIVVCIGLTRQQLPYWRDSETLFRHALAVTENNYLAHNNLGDALQRKGQIDDAIREYREAIRLKPGYVDAHYNLGNLLFKHGQTDEAIAQFQEDIRLKPGDIDAYYNLGTAFYKKGQMDQAIKSFQEVVHLKPDYAEARYSLAIALGVKGQMDEAIRQLQEVVRLKPDYADAHDNLAIALDQMGQTDEAIRQYQDYIRLKPNDPKAHCNLGNVFVRKVQFAEAISQFQEAIRLEPDNPDAHENLGNALAASGRLDEAIQNYRQAIHNDSNRPETFFRLGLALNQLGRTREAVDAYRAALKLNPDLAPALNNLAWALATSSDDQLRDGSEAVRLAERACESTHYTQPWFVGTLAAAYAEAGRFQEAVAMAEKAEQLATSAGLTALAAKNRQLLELYRAGKPYHEPAPSRQK